MKYLLTILLVLSVSFYSYNQSYTSFFTGHKEDIFSKPQGGICLMGGSRESDNAMRWFLSRAKGGDVLVLRTSGSDGYNSYLYEELGVPINSVETIVFHDSTASYNTYVHHKIAKAEAIWLAGGNQWNYVKYWRDTPIMHLINEGIKERNIVIGGTSAGMAVLGQYYFSASEGTVSSKEALRNPYDKRVDIDSSSFIHLGWMNNTLTDTHYDNRDRKGRHITFLARMNKDFNIEAKGIACNEKTAVCIDTDGKAYVYGSSDNEESIAYFIKINQNNGLKMPEQWSSGRPLIWDHEGSALKVYSIRGTESGTNFFNLSTWDFGHGGIWQFWSVNNGKVNIQSADHSKD